MFKSARIKLSFWYLVVVMIVSTLFSLGIYGVATKEMQRGFQRAEIRVAAEKKGVPLPAAWPRRLEMMDPKFLETVTELFQEDLEAAKKRLGWQLMILNGFIWLGAGTAGYFLAGKTLRPIEEAVEKQKRFVANASHELRTPLAAMRAGMEVALREKRLGIKEAREALQEGVEEVEKLEKMTADLLSLARYQEGKTQAKEKVELKALTEKVLGKMKVLSQEKGIKVEVSLGKVRLLARKEELERLLVILVENAIKYTGRGGKIWVKCGKRRGGSFLSVQDSGKGIKEKDLAYVFERFWRGKESQGKGQGLGLALAQEIARGHGGEIRVKSQPGKGSEFLVQIPLS